MDDEVKGKGNSVNYKYRMHDPRIGRFFAVDPLSPNYSHYTPYQFSGNKVIDHVELEGLEERGMTESQDPAHLSLLRRDGMTSTGKHADYYKYAVHNQGIAGGIGLVVIFTGGMAVALGPEVVAAYIIEEGLEYAFEEATGIPVLTDPVDFIEQLIKKGGKKLSLEAVQKLKHYVYNVKEYGAYAAKKLKNATGTFDQARNFRHNVDEFGEDIAKQYSKGKITRADASIKSGKKYWTKSTKFKGTKVFQRDDLIDIKLTDAKGRSNLERMESGLAPIGPDGESINIHHMLQSEDAGMAEMTATFHQKNHKTIHINTNKTPSGIDRNAFKKWKRGYWKSRANDFKK